MVEGEGGEIPERARGDVQRQRGVPAQPSVVGGGLSPPQDGRGVRAGWLDAVGAAYQRLELVLLDRAFNGTEKLLTRRDGSEERMREYSNQLGLALLKMHRDTATGAAPESEPENIDELRERLFNKLERLRKRRSARQHRVTPRELREQTIALAKSPIEVQRRVIANMTWQDVQRVDAEYERWVDEGQIEPPDEGWRVWLMMAGRGFGKTRAGAEWIHSVANARPGARIALVGATIADARSIMVEGVSGLLAVAKLHGRRVPVGAEPGVVALAQRKRGAIVLGR